MRTICFIIHGIGNQDADFSTLLQEAIHKQLLKRAPARAKAATSTITVTDITGSIHYVPLFWANIGSQEQEDLYRQIYPKLYGKKGLIQELLNIRQLGFVRDLSIKLIGDIFAYLGKFQEQIKFRVYEGIVAALTPVIESGEPVSIIIVGHSLGTVIVHDLLSSLVKYQFTAFEHLVSKTTIISMGSPISLFSLVGQNAPPEKFHRWINVYHRRDPIAFPIKPLFRTVEDVQISYFFHPTLWLQAYKTHTLYWHHSKVHKLIADEIIDHAVNKLPAACPYAITGVPPLEVFQPGNRITAEAGLTDYHADFNQFRFYDLISNSSQIDILNIYGATWAALQSGAFKNALLNPKADLRICMLSPKSPSLDGICFRFQKTPDELKRKIFDASAEYMKAFDSANKECGHPGRLRIYYSMNPSSHGFYRFDNQLYITPRPTSGDKLVSTPVPILGYRKTQGQGGMLTWMTRDFEFLVNSPQDSELVFDSASKMDNVPRAP